MFKVRIVVGISYPHTNFAKTTPKFPKVGIQPIHVLNTLVLIGTIIQFSNMWYLLIEWINCESYGLITFLFTEWLWSKVRRFCPKSASVRRPLEPRCSTVLYTMLSLSFAIEPELRSYYGNSMYTSVNFWALYTWPCLYIGYRPSKFVVVVILTNRSSVKTTKSED